MAFTIAGINFRETSGFVTDGTDEIYCIGDTYPTTRSLTGSGESATFGWSANVATTRDRNAGVDRRLAGLNNNSVNTTDYFRLDLPSTGSWTVDAALGDHDNPDDIDMDFRDGTSSVLFTVDGSTGATQWMDASDTLRTSVSDWVNNHATVTHTFGQTSITLLQGISGVNISHVKVAQAGGGGGAPNLVARKATHLRKLRAA